MKQNHYILRIFTVLFLLGITFQQAFSQFKTIGYFPSWSGAVSQIQFSKLTHINYSFLLPTSTGGLQPIENPSKLQSLVSSGHASGVKVLIAVGGWNLGAGGGNDGAFESLAANASYRTAFVNNLVNFVNQYGLDGVDVDWEYPDPGASANNYALLMQELANAMHSRGKLLSAAVVSNGYTGGGVLSSVFGYVDFLNLMAYDGNSFDHSTYNYAVESLNYWIGRGLPKSKAILGVPFYGRDSWESFAQLVARGADPYADIFGNVGYNGITTIKSKTNLAFDQGGGIMIWELSHDIIGANSLLTAINQVVVSRGTTTNTPPTVSITSPANNATFTAPASITINATAADANGTVSNVQFYNGTTLLGSDATSPYSFIWGSVAAGTYSITARATDNAAAVTTSSAVNISVTQATATQSPYGGTVRAIPGKIEAEHYDLGGQAVAFNDATATNEGAALRTDAVDIEATTDAGAGHNVGWIAAGEWLEYTVNVTTAGTFKLDARVAALTGTRTFHVELDGQNISGAITAPATGGWQTWTTVSVTTSSLTVGQKVLRIAMDGGDFNLNSVTFSATTTTPNNAPTTSITSPANGSIYTAPASVTINASATDADGEISKVDFYNGSTLLFSDNVTPYTYTWTGVAAGTYSLTVRATDKAGATTTSTAVSITVNGIVANTPPTASITSPANGASFTAPATITINASASDANGTVTRVDFYNGTTLLSSDATAPYSHTISSAAAGTYSLKAVAIDNANAIGTSAIVTVTVSNPTNNTTVGINGPSCVTPGVAATFIFNPEPGFTTGTWWTTGEATTATSSDTKIATITYTGNALGTVSISMGANYSVAPWYKGYTKTVTVSNTCATAARVAAPQLLTSPHPFKDEASVSLESGEQILSLKVFDVKGNEVLNKVNINMDKISLGSDLKPGIYILKIITENGSYTERIIKSE